MKRIMALAILTLTISMHLQSYNLTIVNNAGTPIGVTAFGSGHQVTQPALVGHNFWVYQNIDQIEALDIQGVPFTPAGGMLMSEPQSALKEAQRSAANLHKDMTLTVKFRPGRGGFASIE